MIMDLLLAFAIIFVPLFGFTKGVKVALTCYSDPKDKSFEELIQEKPYPQRECNENLIPLCISVTLLVITHIYMYLAHAESVFSPQYYMLAYLMVLTLAGVLSIYTDYKYAVISRLITNLTIGFGIVCNLLTVFQCEQSSDIYIASLTSLLTFIILVFLFKVSSTLFDTQIGGGDIRLILAVTLGLPHEYFGRFAILVSILALCNYLIRGLYSLIKTKKWTSNRVIRLGVWMGVSLIVICLQYIPAIYN